jgi:alcohol dehydrogenase class IV
MWYFRSPEIVFGEDALDHLDTLKGKRAFIVTDPVVIQLGFVALIGRHLLNAGIEYDLFSDIPREPSLAAINVGAAKLAAFEPDWIIGLGGGSAMDAAKAMWILYENPGIDLETINPFSAITLRQKARLMAIPTTSGTGSECTWALVLTDTREDRKLGLGVPEVLPDLAIIDPLLPQQMPPQLTADTGMDVLTQAIEGYTAALHNDFSDGVCLKALELVFNYLPRAVKDGHDLTAREKMHNAATLAGLGFGNSMAALAHSLGHSFGAIFHVPHGRAVGLFLPYTIEFIARGPAPTRFHELSRFLGLPAATPAEGAASLVKAVHQLAQSIGQPLTIPATLDLSPEAFEAELPRLVANAEADTVIAMASRIPTGEQVAGLFRAAYHGHTIDF